MSLSRRDFLKALGVFSAAAPVFSRVSLAEAFQPPEVFTLKLFHEEFNYGRVYGLATRIERVEPEKRYDRWTHAVKWKPFDDNWEYSPASARVASEALLQATKEILSREGAPIDWVDKAWRKEERKLRSLGLLGV